MDDVRSFRQPEDAIEIGYEIGCNLRRAGAGKGSENRKLRSWAGDKLDRPNFVFWQMGFRAGYRGFPKPDAPMFFGQNPVVTAE